ncbi:MAG: hypothetical protein K2I06_00415, partial [Ruminococcus sp.]|nr:hypothetical protein [Ruminococcus sp.]
MKKTITLNFKSDISSEIFFFLSYAIFLTTCVLRQSFYIRYIPELIFKVIIIFSVFLLVIYEALNYGLKLKELFALCFCGCISLLLYHNNYSLLPLFLFIFCGRNIPLQKIAKITVSIGFVLIVFIILSAYAGVIPNYTSIGDLNGEVRVRHYMGFTYALFLPGFLFNLICLDLYEYKDQISLARCFFWMLVSYLAYYQTQSRLSFCLSIAVIIMFYFLNKFPDILKKRKIITFAMASSFIICCILSL